MAGGLVVPQSSSREAEAWVPPSQGALGKGHPLLVEQGANFGQGGVANGPGREGGDRGGSGPFCEGAASPSQEDLRTEPGWGPGPVWPRQATSHPQPHLGSMGSSVRPSASFQVLGPGLWPGLCSPSGLGGDLSRWGREGTKASRFPPCPLRVVMGWGQVHAHAQVGMSVITWSNPRLLQMVPHIAPAATWSSLQARTICLQEVPSLPGTLPIILGALHLCPVHAGPVNSLSPAAPAPAQVPAAQPTPGWNG